MDFEEKLSVIYDEPTLPPDLSEKYHILSCLKYNDKKHIFLIAENSSENKFILKCAYGQFASLLKREMSILKEAEKVTACPKGRPEVHTIQPGKTIQKCCRSMQGN